MSLHDFGGHPMLHHYNFLMAQRRQKELWQEAEHERIIQQATPKVPAFYRHWRKSSLLTKYIRSLALPDLLRD